MGATPLGTAPGRPATLGPLDDDSNVVSVDRSGTGLASIFTVVVSDCISG